MSLAIGILVLGIALILLAKWLERRRDSVSVFAAMAALVTGTVIAFIGAILALIFWVF